MKITEFRKLIREEIRKVVNEVDYTGVYKPVGLGFILSIVGNTADGKKFSGPYKLAPNHKVKLMIIEKGAGYKIPSITYLSIFQSQLVGEDLGKVSIQINIPWGPVDKMGKDLMAIISKTYISNIAKIDRGGSLTDAGEVKKLLSAVVTQKWPLLTDDAVNNPKALRMMYGMGAAIERVAAVQ